MTEPFERGGYFDISGGGDADVTIRHIIPGCSWTATIPADDEAATMGDLRDITRAHAETCNALRADTLGPFLQPDYIAAPVNGAPIALMRREGGAR